MRKMSGSRRMAAFILALGAMMAYSTPAADALLYDDEVKPTYTIKFRKGTMTPINEADIQEAALIAKKEKKMAQVEGFSCMDDGPNSDGVTRVNMADKRASVVMHKLIYHGVPEKNVYSMSYEYGNCVAVITLVAQ